MDIYFSKVKENGKIPEKESEDAGYDIYPCFEENFIKLNDGETKLVPTGIASAFDSGYYMQIEERGSTGSKGIKKSAGVFDSGYRGEWLIPIVNTNTKPIYIVKQDSLKTLCDALIFLQEEAIVYPYEKAIAQAVLHILPESSVVEKDYEELKAIPSKRGTGKLGSSGK